MARHGGPGMMRSTDRRAASAPARPGSGRQARRAVRTPAVGRVPASTRMAQGWLSRMEERIRVCNCAGCGRVLLGRGQHGLMTAAALVLGERPGRLAGRHEDRPYCAECLALVKSEGARRGVGEGATEP
jgi:hypothetical protein